MKSDEIVQRRMHNQRLWGGSFERPEEVVRWLGAIQAQEYQFAKWSVAQRTTGIDDAAMEQAFADGVLLRTHILRPTWHFVAPEDLRWMLSLSAPRVNAMSAYYYRQLELDDELIARTNKLIADAVEGGQHRTRKEIGAVLDRAGIKARGPRLAYVMFRAELDAVVCSGSRRGKQHTYALFDERVPQAKPVDRDDALARLTGRYFASRGPATLKDFLWWSSLTAADGRRGLDLINSELEREEIDGRTYWFAGSKPPAAPAKTIDLVQVYDEFVIAYKESRDVLAGSTTPSSEFMFTHAILGNGRLVGHWKPVAKRSSVVIEAAFYRSPGRFEARALDAAVERYGRFIGGPVTVRATQGTPPAPK